METTSVPTPSAAKLTACWEHFSHVPQHAEISLRFASKAEAEAYAATLPKAINAKASGGEQTDGTTYGSVYVHADFMAKKGNAVNETGVRRIVKALATFAKMGQELEYLTCYGNSYASVADFLAAIGAEDVK